ncbi:regulator of G-protein signaling 21-like isoform X1 [Antedon mediterranea]|uniref:regulator of G-protein signaling 21-like isoform X1 n=1 Tax=Antedon mediterranea TaxID=105859 RepID=UPI003AF595D8
MQRPAWEATTTTWTFCRTKERYSALSMRTEGEELRGPGTASVSNLEANDDEEENSPRACCFCWCWCCSCRWYVVHGRSCCRLNSSCKADNLTPAGVSLQKCEVGAESLTMSPSETSALPASMQTNYAPTEDELRAWSRSFDTMVRSTNGLRAFREFLCSEYSEENLMFWLACEELHTLSEAVKIEERARIMYEDYISILSPKEVSLDSRVREIVNRNMVDPTVYTFDEAQKQIYTLMQRDSFPRFLNSKLYKSLLLKSQSQPQGNC